MKDERLPPPVTIDPIDATGFRIEAAPTTPLMTSSSGSSIALSLIVLPSSTGEGSDGDDAVMVLVDKGIDQDRADGFRQSHGEHNRRWGFGGKVGTDAAHKGAHCEVAPAKDGAAWRMVCFIFSS